MTGKFLLVSGFWMATCAGVVSAQSFVGITGGASLPMGNFNKSNYTDVTSGFAKAGGNIGLTAVYMIGKKPFGIAGLISHQGFSFNGLQNLADGYKAGYATDSITIVTNGTNHLFNVFFGPYYSLSLTKKLAVDFRVLGGLTHANIAGYHATFEAAQNGFIQQEASAYCPGGQAGIAPGYEIGKHTGIMLGVDYFYAKPDFKITYAGSNTPPSNRTLPATYNQPLSGINANITLYRKL